MECNGYKGSDLFVKTLSSLNEKISLEERLFRQFVNSDEYEQVKGDIDIYCKKEEFFLRMTTILQGIPLYTRRTGFITSYTPSAIAYCTARPEILRSSPSRKPCR